VLTFVLEGLLFILIGFQIPILLVATAAIPSPKIVGFALIVTLAAIFIRIIWTFGTTYLPMVLSHGSHQSTYPSWRETAIVAWAGMRGALSFVLALALPTVTNTGEAFPGRELIIFVTFGVILTTLLLHGLTLPTLIRWLRVEEAYEARKHETEEMVALRRLIEAALARVDELAAQPATPREALEKVRTQLLHQLHDLSGEVSQQHREQDFAVRQLEIEVLAAERREAARLYDQGVISDEVLNRIKQHLDMEELRLAMEESAFPQPPKS
jgi:CPA1 family monovalent cation:H+ antiporter